MVMMGINRIVVTDGKIAAKVLYDFQARDNSRSKTSATKFDYGDQYQCPPSSDCEATSEGGELTPSGTGKVGDESWRQLLLEGQVQDPARSQC